MTNFEFIILTLLFVISVSLGALGAYQSYKFRKEIENKLWHK